nr:MAG TPA: hypothetical protein [Caudoviricetes sp.]
MIMTRLFFIRSIRSTRYSQNLDNICVYSLLITTKKFFCFVQ